MSEEPALDPERPIIDPHLHLWEIRRAPDAPQEPQRFLLDELLATVAASGHTITHTVFVESHQMYRADGPAEIAPIGETEFANGIAAMGASGQYGPCRVAHRIVGSADLRLGVGVTAVLRAHVARAGERFRGIRMATAWSAAGLFGLPPDPSGAGILADPAFVEGARVLAAMDLSLDVWCLHSQLGELTALAGAVPELTIVLDHIGSPEAGGRWGGDEPPVRAEWERGIAELARCANVRVKLGGMGMNFSGPLASVPGPGTSEQLAGRWRPYVETCLAAFGAERAMFESNFPPDQAAATYGATWNAFKRIARDYAPADKDRLFRGTAAEVYRIAL
ncbi:MAG: amidohydrolase family protein [Novosphingobium sp.]|nr:amidohydrolase family protein [Novosphingobium sp.]